MKTTVRNTAIKSAAFLMIGMMGMLVANKAIFFHAHKLNNGTVIEHSHPYHKSNDSEPYKSHHHTKAEFLFFENSEILILILFLTYALINIAIKSKLSIYIFTNYVPACIILHKGRAPPVW